MSGSADDILYAFRTNVVVTASAGTGKTFRLVALYALLTLGLTSRGERDADPAAAPVSPRRIAATTFSRAAAAEIRERVERVLRAVAEGRFESGTEAYRQVIDARARATRSPDTSSRILQERARAAMDDLPHALIDTLHGLAGRIVRASALDLGITPGFAVLDEDRARVSADAATEEVLSRALTGGNRAAVDLLDAGGGLMMTRRRVADLLDRADEEGVSLEQLEIPDFTVTARDTMARLGDVCDRLAREGSRAFGESAAAVRDLARRWLDQGSTEGELAAAFDPLFSRRSPARPTATENEFLAFRESVKAETNPARARRLAAFVASAHELGPRTQGVTTLLADIARRRSSERQQVGALGFGDLLRAARDALRDDPRLAIAAGSMFDVLMVDEFQDTSRVQRDIVYLLRERRDSAVRRNAGALPTAADLEPSGLLVVGDRKQSIYAFRGADVTLFGRVAAELAGESARTALRLGDHFEVPAVPNAALVTLSESRRSAPPLLAFVNGFADADFGPATYPFDLRYAESEHLRPVEGTPAAGEARVVVVEDDGQTPSDFPALLHGASPPMREALVAAGVIERAVRESGGSLRFGDFAVLARRRATLPLLEFALERLAVPHVVAGRGLFETREVRDVLAILRLMLDPYDRHALATVLRGPGVALSDRSLALLSESGSGLRPPSAWFGGDAAAARLPDDERANLRRFAAILDDLRRVTLGLAPADAIRHATERLEIDRVIAALPRATQRLGNLDRLVDLAFARGGSLSEFVRWLERQIADETDESEAALVDESEDAVKLMTIHASKGLEFPAVVLVDLGGAVRAPPLSLALDAGSPARRAQLVLRHVHAHGGSLFTPQGAAFSREARAREAAERRRLTYVAMTRARERLFLILPPQAPNDSAAATLRRVLPELGPLARTERAETYLRYEPLSAPSSHAVAGDVVAPDPLPASERGQLTIGATQLATFDACPRRYRLLHELAVDPPPYDLAPGFESDRASRDERLALGIAAHRVLQRWPAARWGHPAEPADFVRALVDEGAPARGENTARVAAHVAGFIAGDYARQLQGEGVVVFREEAFVVPVESTAGTLLLRGTFDLLALGPDASADVLDYKSSPTTSPEAHEFQLRAYALAARRRYGAQRVRVGLLNLGLGAEPTWAKIGDDELVEFERHLMDLRRRFLIARSSVDFSGIPVGACRMLRCGFIRACHGAADREI